MALYRPVKRIFDEILNLGPRERNSLPFLEGMALAASWNKLVLKVDLALCAGFDGDRLPMAVTVHLTNRIKSVLEGLAVSSKAYNG
ncbi:unnamed protein product [Parascedosporium putredinis]|uniref:Uncharacterized protein n=1 Tax=Parascedosporium putredinis TaxID=1442378 RepID=A0A9P1H8Z1_9PEZI|nr:unnamed protein product [Parascedosporium putredinis]CAI8000287.1 unnamed protein product [Parascedosporium putredinis]